MPIQVKPLDGALCGMFKTANYHRGANIAEKTNKLTKRAKSTEDLLAEDAEYTGSIRKRVDSEMKKIEYSPVDKQISFIKTLVKDQVKADEFMKDPVAYAEKRKVVLSPDVVKTLSDSILYETAITKSTVKIVGEENLKDLVDMRRWAVDNDIEEGKTRYLPDFVILLSRAARVVKSFGPCKIDPMPRRVLSKTIPMKIMPNCVMTAQRGDHKTQMAKKKIRR